MRGRKFLLAMTVLALPAMAYAQVPADIARQNDKLNKMLCDARRCPVFVFSKDHNHNSQLYAVGSGDETITRPLLEFVRKHTR